MNNKPLVSTIIPTYKRADMLSRAIDSVLNQSYTNVEVIVVDDNDPASEHRNKTEQIMRKYQDNKKVKYIKHSKNYNGSVARNTGITNAEGFYVCFLDDDNYFYPAKLEKQVNYLTINKKYKAVYCGLKYKDKDVLYDKEGDLSYEQLMGTHIIDTNMIMIERLIAIKMGGWDERLKRNQDVSFMLRYFRLGYKIGVIKEILCFIDLSDRSNMGSPTQNERYIKQFLDLYKEDIAVCEQRIKNAKKNIYSFRFRGVLLFYIKNKDFKNAFKLYLDMFRFSPLVFNKYLFTGLLNKIKGKPL
ncbi:glycosyltransferase family 2 protein [Virgibacillus pantothenticus]|uniref:glycosyltransferase family 2 protein n=1 Tax=Virgibacillus pantothenticus TaxID=1473 RepID=UPI00147D9318|nr:glycosyltransferase family 2 protein [Virgibacillus pantothenticus]